MEASEKARLAKLLGALVVANMVLGVLTALGGLYGIFWGTLTQAGAHFSETLTGIRLPTEVVATPLYFWVHVLLVAQGVGLILGAALMVSRWPGGRALNVFVAAGGIGLLLVALVGGLAESWSDWGWGLLRMGYLVALVVILWQRRMREFWSRSAPSG